MTQYLVYQTDSHHSYASRDLIAICTSKKTAISLIKKHADKQNEKISEDDLYNLQHINQTQGFEGEGEYVIESMEQNILF